MMLLLLLVVVDERLLFHGHIHVGWDGHGRGGYDIHIIVVHIVIDVVWDGGGGCIAGSSSSRRFLCRDLFCCEKSASGAAGATHGVFVSGFMEVGLHWGKIRKNGEKKDGCGWVPFSAWRGDVLPLVLRELHDALGCENTVLRLHIGVLRRWGYRLGSGQRCLAGRGCLRVRLVGGCGVG